MEGFKTIAQAAELIGVSRQRVQQWLAEGVIQGAEKIGVYWLIPISEIERLAGERSHRHAGRPPKRSD